MLSALLLAGLIAAPLATVALFLPAGRRARRAEQPAQRAARLTAALVGSALLIAIVAAILALIGVTTGHLEAAVVGLALACLLWLPVTRRWNARAHLSWASTTYVFVVYLAFMAWWTFASHLGITGDVGGMLLWLLELLAAVLGCAYLWELCDTLGRASWVRRVGTQELAEMPDGPYPSVCLQVPCYNEPPDMVIQTLESLRSLDYPSYEIQGGRFRLPDRSAVPQALCPVVRRPEGGIHPGAAGLPGLAGRAVLPAPLLLLPLLLRGLAAVAQRARRGDLRRHDGPHPPPRARAGRRVGRVVHHRGRGAVAAHPAKRMVGPPRGPVVRQGDHAAHLRGAEGPALPLVLRGHSDPAPALAFLAARRSRGWAGTQSSGEPDDARAASQAPCHAARPAASCLARCSCGLPWASSRRRTTA